jgi:hypothetical protein
MSSVPGLPIESSCETDGEAADYEVHYKVNQGTFIIWTDEGFIKQVGKECSEVFGDHTVYWSPLAEAYPDNIDWAEMVLEIQVVEKMSGEIVLSTTDHKIYQEGYFFALDQLPAPKQEASVLQEGLAVYALIYEEAMPLGRDGKPVKSKMVIDPTPIFTHEDLAYVDWEQQAWYFTDSFLEEKLKDRDMTSDRFEVSDSQNDALLNIEGAVLLGDYHQFVIVVDGTSIYEGYFQPPMYSSFLPMGPIISDIDDIGIQISMTGILGSKDLRYDDRIKGVLERYELLE